MPSILFIGVTLTAGQGPQAGSPVELAFGTTFNEFTGAARSMTADRLVGAGEAIDFHLSGEPTDLVYLVYQIGQAPLFLPTLSGTLIPKWPAPLAFAGTLPGSGELELAIPFAGLPPGLDSVPLVVQGNFIDPTTPSGYTGYLGTPLDILLRSCATTYGEPDCNANGRADDCDISAGLSSDENENWIPDECEFFATWRVDDDAPGDPGPGNPLISDPLEDGSALHPFDAIAEAVAAAQDFETVLIADGLYAGAGNRDIDLGTKSLVVRSEHGAATCVIDALGLGRGFRGSGQVPWARIEGLTIRNGAVLGSASGGGIQLNDSRATIAACVIDSCSAGWFGGGLHLLGFRGRIQGCLIQDNTSLSGGGLHSSTDGAADQYSDFSIEDCVFRGNVSTSTSFSSGGGGVYALGSCRIVRSIFVDNSSAAGGGGAFIYASNFCCPSFDGTSEIRSSLFFGNDAPLGGGLALRGECVMVGVTLAHNDATSRGGGILVDSTGSTEHPVLASSILWGNTAPLGAQLALDDAVAVIAVHHSDIPGGAPGVFVLPGASLLYGLGNLDVDPAFVAPLSEDYHLAPGSPCIDAGDPAFAAEPGETDLDGQPRVQGAAIDMGADEAG